MSGLYGNVADQSAKNENASPIKEFGEFYAIVEKTKVVQGDKGTHAIVEVKVAEVFDGPYVPQTLVCHMQQKGKHTMFEDFIATYVAEFNGVPKGHQFFDDDKENKAKWVELSEQLFGKAVANPQTQKWEFIHDNPMKGVVLHYKITPQLGWTKDAKGNKIPKLDDNGNQRVFPNIRVLGSKVKTDLTPEFLAKHAKDLHPAYA